MYLSGNEFIYDGVNSTKYDLRFMEIDTEHFNKLAGTLTHQNTFLQNAKRRVINGVVYADSALEFEAEIISEKPISIRDKREIENWLFYQTSYKKLYVNPATYDEGEVVDYPYMRVAPGDENFSRFRVYPYVGCVFTDPVEIEYSSGTHGWKCKVVCDAPFASLDAVKISVSSAYMQHYGTGLNSFEFDVDTDIKDYTYPLIKFTIPDGAEGRIEWVNKSDDENRRFIVEGLESPISLYCNSEINRLADSTFANSTSYYSYITSREFPRLVPGTNTIIVSDNISNVEIQWQNRRWFL